MLPGLRRSEGRGRAGPYYVHKGSRCASTCLPRATAEHSHVSHSPGPRPDPTLVQSRPLNASVHQLWGQLHRAIARAQYAVLPRRWRDHAPRCRASAELARPILARCTSDAERLASWPDRKSRPSHISRCRAASGGMALACGCQCAGSSPSAARRDILQPYRPTTIAVMSSATWGGPRRSVRVDENPRLILFNKTF
jgi:hypothetical protein